MSIDSLRKGIDGSLNKELRYFLKQFRYTSFVDHGGENLTVGYLLPNSKNLDKIQNLVRER